MGIALARAQELQAQQRFLDHQVFLLQVELAKQKSAALAPHRMLAKHH